jgi:hypothetical protein
MLVFILTPKRNRIQSSKTSDCGLLKTYMTKNIKNSERDKAKNG